MAKNKKSNLETTKTFIEDMNALAEDLYIVRQSLLTHEDRFKKETDDLYKHEAMLKSQLLEQLKAVGLKSVKVSSGDSWVISKRPAVEILNEGQFNLWAFKNRLVMPDKSKVKDHLKALVKKGEELPLCVEFTNTDSISIRKNKE